jgi:NNP family nitrate/nitrite transporter-like MFS transporter
MTDGKNYKAQMSMLPSIAGLAGATLRVVNTFMVAVNGGQCSNAMNSTLTILPMAAIGIAFASGNVPFWLLCLLAASSGFGGGAFASSMSGISFFFPKSQQGMALGLNAGIGNLGVSLTQLLIPQVCSFSLFGGEDLGTKYPKNAGFFYVILLFLAATPAWLFANYMPQHGSEKGSMVQNVLGYLRLEGIGYVGIAVGAGLFLAVNPLVKGSPPLIIARILVLAVLACLSTLIALWFCSSAPIKAKLRTQSVVFYDKHTWAMTWLYIMTFGSFIGYSSAFPKLIKDVFGYLPNGDKNPNAPDVATYAWMGACVGSLARPAGGWLSDKLGPQGGAIVTHWGTIIEIVTTVLVGVFVRLALNAEQPETYFFPFLVCFLFLFGSTGSSNGSTFRQISVMFPPEQAGPVLGWTSAVAAYGAAVFPACFGAGIKGDFVDIVLYVFAAYYVSCLFVNYWFYYRTNAEKPC